MDNALEASIKSKEKFVMIEVFEQNDNVIIIIENSYNNKVDINDDLEEIITNIADNKKDFFFVFENESLKGIITKTDLINGIF